jgi:hypothetical protein
MSNKSRKKTTKHISYVQYIPPRKYYGLYGLI